MCGEAERRKPRRSIFINQRGLLRRLNTVRIASYPPQGKEKKAMKLPQNPRVWYLLIVCSTLLITLFLTRNSFCEIRYKDGPLEVVALMAYESGK
jgi:protein HokB